MICAAVIYGVEAGAATTPPTVHRTASTTINYLVPNVLGAATEEPYLMLMSINTEI